MDAQTVQTAVVIVAPIVGAALYLIRSELRGDVTRLDGRIDTQAALQDELKDDVRYIRTRIDQALDGKR